MTNTLRVHILRPFEGDALHLLEDSLASNIRYTAGEEFPAPADFHVLVGGRPSRTFLEASPDLWGVVIPWAGVPTSTRALLEDFPHLALHNLHHNAAPTAEMALTLLMAAAKQVVPFDQALRSYDWRPRYRPSKTLLLAGKTALIVGYGEIGRRVGDGLKAMGVDVVGIRRRGGGIPAGGVEIYPPNALRELLPRANFLIITLPLTPETRGLIGAAELALLPPQAVLVNVSRGPIIEQEALYLALKEKKLYAAGLDVWYNYPRAEGEREQTPPADFPFHELENVVMSPHRGGSTQATQRLRVTHLAKSLNAAARGEEMPNKVDLERGY